MSDCCGMNNMNHRKPPFPGAVPCPTPPPVVTPVDGQCREALAVQDGALPQVIVVANLPLLGGTRTAAIGFDRFVINQIGAEAALVNPPGFAGSLVLPGIIAPGSFNGVRVTRSGFYDLTAGLSLVGAAITVLPPGGITAQIVRFPGGVGTNTPEVIAVIPLNVTLDISLAVVGLDIPLLRGTVDVPNQRLNAGDVVGIQIVISDALLSAAVLAVTYAFLEIEE